MKRLISIFFIFMAVWTCAKAEIPMGESLNYRVMYKWGLVNKQAGHVNISTSKLNNRHFRATLVAATEKWADHFYKVRDTLQGYISKITYEPDLYEKITHEGGTYKYDKITYSRSGNHVSARCERTKQKKANQPIDYSEITLEAEGLTLDMLSAFYYMRDINYSGMNPGDSVELNVFSGKRKELLTITYRGMEDIDVKKEKFNCYHITFKFTGEQGKQTSDNMDAWISTNPDHIPIKLEGKLAVGKVQCFLVTKDE